MEDGYRIFDRDLVKKRVRHRDDKAPDYLFREGANGLFERLLDINRTFDQVFTLGPMLDTKGLKFKPKALIAGKANLGVDEEHLPLKEKSVDLVLNNLRLHWVNDLPGALIQARRSLREDGLFLASMFGGDTLIELRQSLLAGEAETTGGASPRISPFADVRDAGDLLSRAGFTMPVADIERITVTFDHPLKLMRDLKAMGENNALLGRSKAFTRKDTMKAAIDHYFQNYSNEEGRILATFQIIYLTGWAPGPNQPKPLKPGSGKVSLKDALKS